MAVETVTAQIPDRKLKTEQPYDFGANLEESVALFGADVVYGAFKAAAKIGLQANLRSWLDKGKTDEEITQLTSTWKPGIRAERVGGDPITSLANKIKKMSPEDQAAFIEKLKLQLAS